MLARAPNTGLQKLGGHRMSENRLGRETSPYLLQHKDNPVHWWAWGPEALAEAKRTGKPILLSVGYAACHWCHVMAHESFEDDGDRGRHERAVRQHQGRPRGAARHRRHLHARAACPGRAGRLAADHVPRQRGAARSGAAPTSRRTPATAARLRRRAARGRARLPRGARQGRRQRQAADRRAGAAAASTADAPTIDDRLLADLTARMVPRRRSGARRPAGRAEVSAVELLLAAVARRHPLRQRAGARRPSTPRSTNICQGGIYDHLGGGFARYSVDERWLVPHFEKMLYDNALLIDLMTEVYRETRHRRCSSRASPRRSAGSSAR